MRTRAAFWFSITAAASLIAGCGSYAMRNSSAGSGTETRPDERGFVAGRGVESQDIISVAEKMAREILSTPEIANAKGVPRIVLLPVKNDTRLPVNKNVFLEKIIAVLNDRSAGKVRFLARDVVTQPEKERDPKVSGQLKGADFMLSGKLIGNGPRPPAPAGDCVVYSCTLTDPQSGDIVCKKSHEITREDLEGPLYHGELHQP